MKNMTYCLFVLDGKRQETVDSLKPKVRSQDYVIDSARGEKLINFLKERYPVILVLNSAQAGVYTHIIVGVNADEAKEIAKDFAKITKELELFFINKGLLTEIV